MFYYKRIRLIEYLLIERQMINMLMKNIDYIEI